MTRRAALTVRFPGAGVMPVTSASTWSQTGAVKKLRKGAVSAMMIDVAIGAAANEEEGRCRVIATVESSRGECDLTPFKPRLRHFDSVRPEPRTRKAPPIHNNGVMTDDDIIQRIDNFAFDAGPVVAQRRNRGFTLIHAARLRPLGRDDLYEILYWSLCNERWAPFGPFGRTALPAEQPTRRRGSLDLLGPPSETGAQKMGKVERRGPCRREGSRRRGS